MTIKFGEKTDIAISSGTNTIVLNGGGNVNSGTVNYGQPGQVLTSNGSGSAASWTTPRSTSVTVDTAITNGSTNPVTNDAIHDALQHKANLSGPNFSGAVSATGPVTCRDVYLKKASNGLGTSRLYTDNSMLRDWLNLEHNSNYRIKLGDFSGLYYQLQSGPHTGLWAIGTSRGLLSDDRLKFNETPITNALTTINKLKVLEYDKSEMLGQSTMRKEIGLIAQDVYNIPELKCAVQPGDEKHEWCLRYNDIFCVAIQAIQELKREIEKLEARIKTLEGKAN